MYFDKQYDESYNQKRFDEVFPILRQLSASGCQTIVEASPPLGRQNLKLLNVVIPICDKKFKYHLKLLAMDVKKNKT
ncbi:hypothetical protein Amet_1427 [Alkaliphilus metalliredigens QYMF]|uniref:Uncharacterized protein n=1 Tax=Alkaliphilus metalliredigens (strain QYMF) TaxID=293826 RepID=A6TN58_ALKMQ|nr:hypothetical protein [Alkaliphilus metalliredigens]ABR47626.1 hypothetical protein Amet_1427 [Alkaliphilus metalliredigens QYMF]